MSERLIIFVKAPRPGTVKTRLGLGGTAECVAYQRLVEVLLHNLVELEPVQLRFAPADGEPEIRDWARVGWTVAPQGEGDLGVRMQAAFAEAFGAGDERVVIIGSDCPYLTAEDIRAAWRALESEDLVLGPAEDGGYWLIGLRVNQPALFSNMAWSSNNVFTETMARAKALGMKPFLLRTLSDVDTREDWERFNSAEAHGRTQRPARGEG